MDWGNLFENSFIPVRMDHVDLLIFQSLLRQISLGRSYLLSFGPKRRHLHLVCWLPRKLHYPQHINRAADLRSRYSTIHHSLPAQSLRRATPFTTSSQILLSRGVAGPDSEQEESLDPASSAPLVTILENASILILYIGPSSAPDIIRLRPMELDSARKPEARAASNDANAPTRPKASPRSTPSNSGRSSFSFRFASEQSESAIPSSEEGSPIRGRTLVRVPTHDNHEPRAMTRLQTGPYIGHLDSSTMRQQILSRGLSSEPEDVDYCYMEPLPFERFRFSLSEELHRTSTFDSSIDLTNFGGHRDTFAVLGLRRMQIPGPELPAAFFEQLVHYLDFEEYLAFRLSCRCWSTGITLARPLMMPPVCQLPTEILEKVYGYLSPVDLNAARHTCRAWMIGSLEERLLTNVLKQGGWWRAAKADMDLHEELNGHRTVDSINEEWLLSKRLATECSLRSDWTGNGISQDLPSLLERRFNRAGIVLASETDFSDLSTGYHPSYTGNTQHGSAFHFTVSVCCKFLLVTDGCLIYIYALRDSIPTSQPHGGHLSPVTTVICPHRVLAVSMDTSSHRFAVAALLEGRVGLVCDIHENTLSSSRRRSTTQAFSTFTSECGPSTYSSASSGEPLATEAASPYKYSTFRASSEDHALARAFAEASLAEVHGARDIRTSWRMNDPLVSPEPGFSQGSPTNAGYIPLESGIRSIYHNLCSAEDPPRSVAICPQRRCVAFGCSAGIELHWIDALTGQDLNRWFPLTVPSEFLYFLPPRPGVDSTKKLRLISSACHPKEKEGLGRRFFPCVSTNAAGQQDMTWDEGLSDPSAWDNMWRGSGWCDHYRAVPISDGWNVLFTDTAQGNLCLGTDAPPGVGATKLIRRFILQGPTEFGETIVPRVYAAGSELRWGVRVVAGYGEAIWLFVVPPDIFFGHQDKKGERQDANALEEPTRIQGVRIGDMPGLVDLAIDASGGSLTIWSLAVNGMAYVWQIAGRNQFVEKRIVLKDGTVTALKDADGDTYMFNQAAVHFDGAAPLRPGPAVDATCLDPSLQPSTHNFLLHSRDHIIDHSGDITMPDADAWKDEGYASGGDDDNDEFMQAGGVFAIHAPPLWGRWSEEDADWVPDYLAQVAGEIEDEGLGVDVLELTRLEVEILCG